MKHSPGFLKLVEDAKSRVQEADFRKVKKWMDEREQIVLIDPGTDLGSVPVFSDLVSLQYVRPEVFDAHREFGEGLGFAHVFAGPFVRSSYRAEEALRASESRAS